MRLWDQNYLRILASDKSIINQLRIRNVAYLWSRLLRNLSLESLLLPTLPPSTVNQICSRHGTSFFLAAHGEVCRLQIFALILLCLDWWILHLCWFRSLAYSAILPPDLFVDESALKSPHFAKEEQYLPARYWLCRLLKCGERLMLVWLLKVKD